MLGCGRHCLRGADAYPDRAERKSLPALRVQDDLAGRAYENSAKWYADIIDNCNGQCGWLSASLQKAFADGLTNAVYGALAVSTGSLPKPGQTVKPVSEATGRGIVPEQGSVANANFAQSKSGPMKHLVPKG